MGYHASDSPAATDRKRRPPELASLHSLSLTAHYDDDAPTRKSQSFGCGEDIPVRRTFIDFGSLVGTPPESPRMAISTAPARMGGFSIRDTFDSWKVIPALRMTTCDSPSGDHLAECPSSTASSTRNSRITVTTDCGSVRHEWEQANDNEIRGKAKHALLSAARSGSLEAALNRTLQGADELPDVTYRLSSDSMKAAGYWREEPEPPLSFCATPSSPSSVCSGDPLDPSALLQNALWKEGFCWPRPQGLDPAAWAQLYAPFGPPLGRRTADAPPAPAASYSSAPAASSSSATCAVGSLLEMPAEAHQLPTTCGLGRLPEQPAASRIESRDQVHQLVAKDGESSDDDGDSSDEDLGLCPTYSANAPLPSSGSALHSEGTCKRCCFFPKGRCNNGYDCQFCHFAHEKRKAKNKKKKKKRRKHKMSSGSAVQNSSSQSAPSRQHQAQSPSVREVFGWSAPSQQQWTQPRCRPSGLVCHGLQFVQPTADPMTSGNMVAMPMVQQLPMAYWPVHYLE